MNSALWELMPLKGQVCAHIAQQVNGLMQGHRLAIIVLPDTNVREMAQKLNVQQELMLLQDQAPAQSAQQENIALQGHRLAIIVLQVHMLQIREPQPAVHVQTENIALQEQAAA